jgi:hypothetical protein
MKIFALVLALALVACGGASERSDSSLDDGSLITWNGRDGLEVTLAEPVAAGALIELGQAVRGPESVHFDPITVDGVPLGGVVLEQSADADGAAVLVSRFEASAPLAAGVVVGCRLVRSGDGSLVRPARAWLSADGVELARREW